MFRFIFVFLLIFIAGCAKDLIKENVEDLIEDFGLNLNEEETKTFAPPLLQSYQTCEQLAKDLKETALREMHTRMVISLNDIPSYPEPLCGAPPPGAGVAMPAPPLAEADAAPVLGIDFSGTNNQEKGVDEADIVKTDGKYFYILNKGKFEILKIEKEGELNLEGSIELDQEGRSILLMNNKAFVLSSEYWNDIEYPGIVLRVYEIDLGKDRKDLKIVNNYYFQGDLLAARKIGNQIHLANYLDNSPQLTYYPEPDYEFYDKSPEEKARIWAELIKEITRKNEDIINRFDFLAMLPNELYLEDNHLIRKVVSESDCLNAFAALDSSSNGFLGLITLNNEEPNNSIKWVRGNEPIVYASPDQFIIASPEHKPWWFYDNHKLKDQTVIHRFKLNQGDLPDYADSVRVLGTLYNSFSLSEYKGYLRVATTTKPRARFWQDALEVEEQEENHLFILGDDNGELSIISSILGLAPGERIWSARFSKDKGFLVTFKQVDPLFTLDLSDPKNPKVAGILKVPGVSTYLQDIGNDQLLAIGYGGDEEGLDFKTSVSLFDVSDFSIPKLSQSLSFAAQEELDDSWSRLTSEANTNHLAVNYFAPLGMTAIPISTHRYVQNSPDDWHGHYEFIAKLVVANTALDKKLSIHGEVDHSSYYSKQNHYYQRPTISRSYFVGDYLYAISPNVITATRISDMETIGALEF